ncbi:MAG: ROK family transcriptional regulator [Spirochaeta sp.]|jgi:glucokinase-like ROK family protein|nr:ROK family transcriptional regulator [Spirochaeta sp.]
MKSDRIEFFGAAAGGAIFDIIRREGPISRAQLVRSTALSKSTISLHVDRLLKVGVIKEEALQTDSGPGRRSLLRFAADRGIVVGIELGVTSIDVAVCDLEALVLASHSEALDIARGPVPVLTRAYEIIETLLSEVKQEGGSLAGIGIGLPGPVNRTLGSVVSPPIMPGWDRYPVRDEVTTHFGVPCFVDNDVNVMALGEARAGSARASESFLFVKIGTGIGAGLVIDGQLYRGFKGSAGDIGHIGIDGETTRCSCGNRGCLEVVAGGGAIARKGRELAESGASPFLSETAARFAAEDPPREITAVEVGIAASQGDTAALELVIESGRHVGSVLAKLVNFFNPEMVILGGGTVNIGDAFVAAIREMVIRRSTQLATVDLVIRRSAFGEQSGMVGAALMVVDELFSTRAVTEMVREFDG